MKILLATVNVLLTVLVVEGANQVGLQKLYSATMEKYHPGKVLTSGADGEARFKYFVQFAQGVDKHNAITESTWTAEVNGLSLMTPAERQQLLGLRNSSDMAQVERRSMSAPVLLEKRALEVDYTDKLPPIKNQGSCGSCWTFGAAAALEYQINRRHSGTPVALSEQQWLDCTYEGVRDGCNGGWPTQCFDWTKDNNNMIASMEDMPYKGVDGTCNTNVESALSGIEVTGTKYLTKGDTAMLDAVRDEEIGVISVAIEVLDSFFSYSSGVYSETGCSSLSINHAVDVVGYGEHNGVDYWRVRNSWGDWGDKGYINMERGLNMCSISNYGHYPVTTGEYNGDDGDDGEDNDDKKLCWEKKAGIKLALQLQGTMKGKLSEAKELCVGGDCLGVVCKIKTKSNGKTKNTNCKMIGKGSDEISNDKFNSYVPVKCSKK